MGAFPFKVDLLSMPPLPQMVVLTVLVTVAVLGVSVIVDVMPSTVKGDAEMVSVMVVAVTVRVPSPRMTGIAVITLMPVVVVTLVVKTELPEVMVFVVVCG